MTDGNPFDGLAARYQANRPDYPDGLLSQLALRAAGAPRVAVDIGAGTGIATRALRRALGPEWSLTGIEPGADMRRQAGESTPPEDAIDYRDGVAETLPFSDGALGVVNVGQAVQFFDRPVFYGEAARVLAGGGVLSVIQNNRACRDSPLLQDYEAFLEANAPGYTRTYRDFDLGAEFAALDWAEDAERLEHRWQSELSAARFAGMMLSRRSMKPAVAARGENYVEDALRAMATRHGNADGAVTIPYVTELFMATKSAEA